MLEVVLVVLADPRLETLLECVKEAQADELAAAAGVVELVVVLLLLLLLLMVVAAALEAREI